MMVSEMQDAGNRETLGRGKLVNVEADLCGQRPAESRRRRDNGNQYQFRFAAREKSRCRCKFVFRAAAVLVTLCQPLLVIGFHSPISVLTALSRARFFVYCPQIISRPACSYPPALL